MRTRTYGSRQDDEAPSLFSITKDLDFFDRAGNIEHRILDEGPKRFKVVSVSSTGHSAAFVENDRTAITLPRSGHARVSVGNRSFKFRPGEMIALGPSERRSRLVPDESKGGYESYTILCPANWPVRLSEEAVFNSPDPKRLKLMELLEFSFSYLSNPDLVSDRTLMLHEMLIEDALIEALDFSGRSAVSSPKDQRYETLVRSAEAYIREHHHEAISVSMIASEIGISNRTLQCAFRARRGITVRSFLTRVRLETMRQRLQNATPGTTATTAALDAGLFHIGRAGMAYREQYGEHPSETLGRSACTTAPSG